MQVPIQVVIASPNLYFQTLSYVSPSTLRDVLHDSNPNSSNSNSNSSSNSNSNTKGNTNICLTFATTVECVVVDYHEHAASMCTDYML